MSIVTAETTKDIFYEFEQIKDAVAKFNDFAQNGTNHIVTDEQKKLMVETTTVTGKGQYGDIYSLKYSSAIQMGQEQIKAQTILLHDRQEKYKNATTTQIREFENNIAPLMVEERKKLDELLEIRVKMKGTKMKIATRLIELRAMGYDGIESNVVKILSRQELESKYGLKFEGWDEYLKLLKSGKLRDDDTFR